MPAENKDRGHVILDYHCWIIPVSVIMELKGNWMLLAESLNQQQIQRKFEQITPDLEPTSLTIEPLTPIQEKEYISAVLQEPDFQSIPTKMIFQQASIISQSAIPLYNANMPLSSDTRLKWIQLITFTIPAQLRYQITFSTLTFDNDVVDMSVNMPYKPMSHFSEKNIIFNWTKKELYHWKPSPDDGYLWAMQNKGIDIIYELDDALARYPNEDKVSVFKIVCYRLWAEHQIANKADNWDVLYETFRDDVTLSEQTSSQILMLLINAYFEEISDDKANQSLRMVYDVNAPCEIWLKAITIKSGDNLFLSPIEDTDEYYHRRYTLLRDLFQTYRDERFIPYLNETIELFSATISQTATEYSKKRMISDDVRNRHVLHITQFMMKLIHDMLSLKMPISTTPFLQDFADLKRYKPAYQSLQMWLIFLDLLNADGNVQPFMPILTSLKKLNPSAKGKMKHLAISENQIKELADEFWRVIFGS